ncbi:MAG TPA: carbonic anhydrase [Nitrospiraceae bacterium]|jgi:carbonic anhydrase|nr:carbonic anhydrase [Nitrospiraceae bacterium]
MDVRISRALVALGCSVAIAGFVYAGIEQGQDSLTKLIDGNIRFMSGGLAKKNIGESKRQELAKGQQPFATVISCSDSRVAPEIIFDQGLGDIFVVRVAGNVVEATTLGSIEYGVEHLHTPLLVILGHESCGAVQAALETKGKPEGNIGAILKKIMPAVNAARKAHKNPSETLNIAIQENIKNTYKDVMKSKIVSELVHEGKLKVIGAEYYLGTGKVELINLSSPAERDKGHPLKKAA